jgi:hypothetical protein
MTSKASVTQSPLPGVTPEQARAARVCGWLYVFECWQENQKTGKPAPEPAGRDEAKIEGDSANVILPE